MTTFGYGRNSRGWSDARKEKLRKALSQLVSTMETEGKFKGIPEDGSEPDVEDGYYNGIEVVGLLHLEPEVRDELVIRAEGIYRDIMSLPPLKSKK